MFSAHFISDSHDFTHHLTSGELILIHSADVASWCRLRARVQRNTLSSLLKNPQQTSLYRDQLWVSNSRVVKYFRWISSFVSGGFFLCVAVFWNLGLAFFYQNISWSGGKKNASHTFSHFPSVCSDKLFFTPI